MIYTEREYLTVIELQNDADSVSLDEIRGLLSEYPSNIIYCEIQRKLAGMISTGDIYRAFEQKQDRVYVNKHFTNLYPGEYLKAKTIFAENEHINAIPVAEEGNVLVGEYMRWNDLMLLENTLKTLAGGGNCIFDLDICQRIALVRPCGFHAKRQEVFALVFDAMLQAGLNVKCVEHMEVGQCLEEFDRIVLIDENEMRACRTALILEHGDDYQAESKLALCKYVLGYDKVLDEQYALYLRELHNKGVEVLGLTLPVFRGSYQDEIFEKFSNREELINSRVPESMYKEFFDDLYSEEYARQVVEMPVRVKNDRGVLKLRDCSSRFYNVVNGERRTFNQPEKYGRTIYFYGPCYTLGYYVEDANTMESFLQKWLTDEKEEVRVVNCGCMWMDGARGCLPRIAATELKRGDIIVTDRPRENIPGVRYLDLDLILRTKKASVQWMVDSPLHCNHKINQVYAEAIYEKIKPLLNKKSGCDGQQVEQSGNIIKKLYLDQYFAAYTASKYKNTGAIVMNCNPFTYGHRYLIEQALNMVDFLIIFVVEEDASFFSFAERFTMVSRGVMDLENVMVVPSGPYILSQMSFSEYFIKETSEDMIAHTEQDIITFANDIAPQLGIKYRFVGEEPEDSVTNQYNSAMKKILPMYGIELIEIGRKRVKGKYISASSVRRYLETNDKEKLIELLPETTRRVMGIT